MRQHVVRTGEASKLDPADQVTTCVRPWFGRRGPQPGREADRTSIKGEQVGLTPEVGGSV